MEKCEHTGKVCYGSERDAANVIRFFRKNGGRHGKIRKDIPKRFYKCKFCGQYHLTHYKDWRGQQY